MRFTIVNVLLAGALVFPGHLAAQDTASGSKSAAARGKVGVDLRYRYERVDQDSFDKVAEAALLRSRVTLESPVRRNFSGLLEVDDVRNLGPDDYNSTENGLGDYPAIADPQGTEVNRAWVRYRGEVVTGTAGRQRIQIGNQRFIGSKPWRQNEQTYDGARLVWTPVEEFVLDASYVYNVNRIFGPANGTNPANLEGENVFVRGDYALRDGHTLSGFAFILDFDANAGFAPGRTVDNSSATYGLEYAGDFGWLAARASWATQSDFGKSELRYNADYYVIELTARLDAFTVRGGFEALGGDDEAAFSTPLAAAHGFQGWADKFLSTPVDGIEDAWVSMAGKLGPVTLEAAFHDFQAEASSADFGTEIDLLATWQVNPAFSIQAKYARFDSAAGERFDDTTKAWLTFQFTL